MSLTLITWEDVHSVERRSLCGTVCGFWTDMCMYLCVYFFILLYIDSTACVELMYSCLFDMKKMFLWLVWKSTLHICNIYQCIIERNVCVYSCYPPGLPPSWQLVYEKRPLMEMLYFGVFFRISSVCRQKRVCWKHSGSTRYISFIILSLENFVRVLKHIFCLCSWNLRTLFPLFRMTFKIKCIS